MGAKGKRFSWKNRILITLGIVIVAAAAVIGFSLKAASFLIDMWWFDSVGYEFYFWQRLLYRHEVFTAATLLLFLLFWLNFRFTTRYVRQAPDSTVEPTATGIVGRILRSGSPFLYIPLSLLLAAVISWPLFRQWEAFLFLDPRFSFDAADDAPEPGSFARPDGGRKPWRQLGRIIVYSFPKGELVFSPSQIAALITAEPEIVGQFNLWNIAGSRIERGKVVILPTQRNVLYVQPVYLEAETRARIPELHRVVLSEGHIAVMGKSAADAYRRLVARVGHNQAIGSGSGGRQQTTRAAAAIIPTPC